jgi:hypothetical protein
MHRCKRWGQTISRYRHGRPQQWDPRMDDVRDQAPDFTAMFTSLLNVMAIQETKERAAFAKQQASQASSAQIMSSASSTTDTKRAADSQNSTGSAKKRLKYNNSPSPPFDARTPQINQPKRKTHILRIQQTNRVVL